VSATPGNSGNLLEFEIAPGNAGNLELMLLKDFIISSVDGTLMSVGLTELILTSAFIDITNFTCIAILYGWSRKKYLVNISAGKWLG